MCIILILFWRILCSKEDTSINKRPFRKHSLQEISVAKHHTLQHIDCNIHFPHNQPFNLVHFEIYQLVVYEKNLGVILHTFSCFTIYIQVLPVSPPIRLLSQFISLHLHSYHLNVSHFFSYLVYCKTVITGSSVPLWLCNNPFSLVQLKWLFRLQPGSHNL